MFPTFVPLNHLRMVEYLMCFVVFNSAPIMRVLRALAYGGIPMRQFCSPLWIELRAHSTTYGAWSLNTNSALVLKAPPLFANGCGTIWSFQQIASWGGGVNAAIFLWIEVGSSWCHTWPQTHIHHMYITSITDGISQRKRVLNQTLLTSPHCPQTKKKVNIY